jgi:hypothetical protein
VISGEIIYATIFMVCFVLLGGVVMYLSKTIDAGEARFDSETGKPLKDASKRPHPSEAKAASRIETTDNGTDT